MIIVPLKGRTGNNLFQYAAGRALAERLGTSLVLDSSWRRMSGQKTANYLKHLPLKATFRSRGYQLFSNLRHLGLRRSQFHFGRIHYDKGTGYDPEFEQLPDRTMLWGFYQSPRYFSHIESKIRTEINLLSVKIPTQSLEFENRLNEANFVSLHVRRGDYLKLQVTQCLTADYYQRSMNLMREKLGSVKFCVFSDDPEWCRKEFPGEEFIICDLPGSSDTPLHDLRLMAACSHHIIANSSYSWWGAWLNPSPTKIVTAPRWWMRGFPSDSVIPESWLSLDA